MRDSRQWHSLCSHFDARKFVQQYIMTNRFIGMYYILSSNCPVYFLFFSFCPLAFFKIPFRGVGRQTVGWFPNIADVGWGFFFLIIWTGRSYTSSNVNLNYNTKANRWWNHRPTYIIETKQKNHQTFDAVCYAGIMCRIERSHHHHQFDNDDDAIRNITSANELWMRFRGAHTRAAWLQLRYQTWSSSFRGSKIKLIWIFSLFENELKNVVFP